MIHPYSVFVCLPQSSNEDFIIGKLLGYGFSVDCLFRGDKLMSRDKEHCVTATLGVTLGTDFLKDVDGNPNVITTALGVVNAVFNIFEENNIAFCNAVVASQLIRDVAFTNGNIAPSKPKEEVK